MVIMEKGLLRLMKEAYKGSGYNVVVVPIDGDTYLYLSHWEWKVGIEMGNVPRKVLGLLAEHMGRLPARGEAFKVSKGSVQKEIYDMADDPLEDLLNCLDNWAAHREVKCTKLEWSGYEVWQDTTDLSIHLVDPAVASLAKYGEIPDVRLEGVHLMIRGVNSFAAINKAYVEDADKPMMAHLAGMQWTA